MNKNDFTQYIGKFVQLTYQPSIDLEVSNNIMGEIRGLWATFMVFDVNNEGKDTPVYYKNIKKIEEIPK